MKTKKWPSMKDGEVRFFGYVVSIGIDINSEWDSYTTFVTFAYNGKREKYKLPQDQTLRKKLTLVLIGNIIELEDGNSIYGKVYIRRVHNGYEVDLA